MVRVNLAYSTGLVKSQLVSHSGKAALIAGGKIDKGEDGRNKIHMSYEAPPFGLSLTNPRVFGRAKAAR